MSICFGGQAELSDDRVEVVRDAVGGEEDDVAGVDEGEAAGEVAQLGVDSVHRAKCAWNKGSESKREKRVGVGKEGAPLGQQKIN